MKKSKSIHAPSSRHPGLDPGPAFTSAQHYRRETEVRPEYKVERDEREAAREWLAHVEAGRIGPEPRD